MIASITGKVKLIEHYIIVETAGIGYKVSVPVPVLEQAKLGQEIFLHTHQYIREDAIDLYGFLNTTDLELFEKFIGISGIGPKAGLALLSQFAADELKRSIIVGDTSLLTKVSGIGKKTAERLILELKETFGSEESVNEDGSSTKKGDSIHALEQLGYSTHEAIEALHDIDHTLPLEEQIKLALKMLGRHK
ncbi:MAG: Holliday junction branch migration protein RuvA [bacterium]|nr:Holliday junction branch migration protein RuvA [bacterium]